MDNIVDYIRLILASTCFVLGCFLIYDLFSGGFDWSVLVGSISCFLLAHYIRPNFGKHNKPDALDWVDVVDIIVDVPFRLVVYAIRAIGSSKHFDSIDL